MSPGIQENEIVMTNAELHQFGNKMFYLTVMEAAVYYVNVSCLTQ